MERILVSKFYFAYIFWLQLSDYLIEIGLWEFMAHTTEKSVCEGWMSLNWEDAVSVISRSGFLYQADLHFFQWTS